MKTSSHLDRRQFVKLGTLAVSAALLPTAAHAESAITLPALPYKFDALEPHIDALTMEIHHDKHHAAYIKNLNAALATAPDLAKQPLDKLLADRPRRRSRHPAARTRCLGARLLPPLSEPPPRLHRRLVEHRQLARRLRAFQGLNLRVREALLAPW